MQPDLSSLMLQAIAVGIGATLAVDVWALLLRRAFGLPSLDWALVGRWLGHLPRGRFMHRRIAESTPVAGERVLGWTFHYAVGIGFATALLLATRGNSAGQPGLLACLLTGWITIVFPFFVMQPALGAGIAASHMPNPGRSRLLSLLTHTVFGIGLYLAARCVAFANG